MNLEILVVLVIIMGLSAVIVPQISNYLRKTKALTTVSEIRALILAIENFRIFEGENPKDTMELVERGYISKIPKDMKIDVSDGDPVILVFKDVDPNVIKVYFPSCTVENGIFKIPLKGSGS
ncbi:MAG: hypothetical protein DRP30_01955 [Thermotoga sp.]|nr:MAG: hypothetical protein DRP30_01955 [Thermotoga sp.]